MGYFHGESVQPYLDAVRDSGALLYDQLGFDVRYDGNNKPSVYDADGKVMSTGFDTPRIKADGTGEFCMSAKDFYSRIPDLDISSLPDGEDFGLTYVEQVLESWYADETTA